MSPADLMPPALMGSVALFAFVSSITPGPNNIMLTASGLSFGFRRSIPHMLGVTLGWMLLLVLCGLGLGALFRQWPPLHGLLQAAGALYLLYLAWRIARAGAVQAGQAGARPLSLLQAAAFQWVNPKAWVMTLGVLAYTPEQHFLANLMLAALICGAVNLPCVSAWTAFGCALRQVLRKPAAVRAFNLAMAALLLASLVPVALES
ncbi:LysE family translocator [Orrella sp. JC864]|uniref:LysE family translocator n=1 Tax=Orrella sp. JC864 TaxID=3120298 RepID=UPI003009DFD2